jgi:hypothetical protein
MQTYKAGIRADWRSANAPLRTMAGTIKNLRGFRDQVAELQALLEMEHPCDVKALKGELEQLCATVQRKIKECEEGEGK